MNKTSEKSEFEILLDTKEDLHPELQEAMRSMPRIGKIIHHPLIIETFTNPMLYAMYNRRFEYKKKAVAEALANKEWDRYVFLHERPYRVEAFLDAVKGGLKSREYWELVHDLWVDSENIFEYQDVWEDIWFDGVPKQAKKWLMDETELAKLESLPKTVEVYRGTKYKGSANALSWTLDKEKAIWFANRFRLPGENAYLVYGVVKKSDIKALFLSRGEDEIVSDNVTVKVIETLPEKKKRAKETSNVG